MNTTILFRLSMAFATAVSVCFMGAFAPQDKQDERIQTELAKLRQTILETPNQKRRLQAVSDMVTRSLATSSYGKDLALVINTAVEILKESNALETEAAALFVENDMLSLDGSILGASVLMRLVGDESYRDICEARWKLINWRKTVLNAYASNSGTPELKERRYLQRIDSLIKATRDISSKMNGLSLDANEVTDDAELSQLLGTSQQARDALWYLSMYYTINEAASQLEGAVARSNLTAAQEKIRLLKTDKTMLMGLSLVLSDECPRLAEIVRRNHLKGVRSSLDGNNTKLTTTGLRYLSNGWTLGLKDKTTLAAQHGVEVILTNPEPQKTLALLASTMEDVELMISVVDIPSGKEDAIRGSNGWVELEVDSPRAGEIKIRFYNLGSVPAEIEIRGYFEPKE